MMFKKIMKAISIRLPFASYPYKRYMHKHQCIFIHIPKNAGTSVYQALGASGGRKHAKWYDFYESNDWFFKRYYKFAIVREPVSRLISAYKYSISGGNQSDSDLALKSLITSNSHDFNSFVMNVLTYDFLLIQPLFLPQYLYVFDRKYQCKVDRLLKYETLEQDWLALANEHNFPKKLPLTNSSLTKARDIEVNDKTLNKIRDMYHLDYSLLQY